jgi:signal transduction histidine kinase
MRASPAAKVAAVATAAIAAVYVIGAVAFNLVLAGHMTDQTDARLANRLAAAQNDPAALSQRVTRAGSSRGVDLGDIDADSAPVFLWSANAEGKITGHSPGAPALPAALLAAQPRRNGLAFTAGLASLGPFRLKMTADGPGWLVAGQSVAGDAHTRQLLLYGEIVAGPFLLLAMFFGLMFVGLRALAPVEQSRRRQLEFTADASHELRTWTTARRPGPASPSDTEPPCASAVDLTMARPSPAPSSPLRLRASSRRENRPKARSASSAGMPGPSSVTVMSAQPPSARTATLTWLAAWRTALSSRFTSSRASASGSPATTR